MCGIAGIVGRESLQNQNAIRRMTDSLQHRGPDAGNIFCEQRVAFGQRRLSIIDLTTDANQPFFDNTGRYSIVFNGEIYNYESIRAKIEYNWRTKSDTEVILAAYIQWGPQCLSYLNGMFAFAIWDRQNEKLFIARDRLGVKPLYYSLNEQYFIFSSEIRSILRSGFVEKRINRNALVGYLSNMAVKTPETIISGLQQLPPGHYAYLENHELNQSVFWNITGKKTRTPTYSGTYPECVTQTRTLLEEAVHSRMVADVPVGAFLSGGIDSSAIVALMSKFSKRPIDTFSIIFNEKEFDESPYARMVAEKYQTNHTELLLEPEEIVRTLPDYLRKMDSPTVDGINTFMVSKLVAERGLKVAVSGLGGDELFAGYRGFSRWSALSRNNRLLNNVVTKTTAKALSLIATNRRVLKLNDYYGRAEKGLQPFYESNRSIFLKKEIFELLGTEKSAAGPHWTDQLLADIHDYPLYSQYTIAELTNYTLDVLLKDTDQMSMAWGLEIREPFFDYRLLEFLLTIPDKYKFSSGVPKQLLVHAMGDLLPDEIVYRTKKGFSFPWDRWIRTTLKDYCGSAISRLKKRDIFNEQKLLRTWDCYLANKQGITWTHIWSLVVLEQWLAENID